MRKKCPRCEGKQIVMVEYAHGNKYRYDGVSEYNCLGCGYREGRWCQQELKGHEVEPMFCQGKGHPCVIQLADDEQTVLGDGNKQ